ncbi:MAG: hypothetical protein HKN49_02925 [Gammaproteobacteria bacterium]|nr:hypothetical protein [Gammaproteobacteria bacterium]
MNKSHVWRALAIMAGSVMCGPALATALDLNLNDDAARLTYASLLADGQLEFDLGWLHHQQRGELLSLSLGRIGEAGGGTQSITAGIGGRVYLVEPDLPVIPGFDADQRGALLGVGGFFRMKLAEYDRIGFAGHGYYAPDVLAFGDAEDLVEIELRLTYSILRDADIYVGARYLKAGFDDIEVNMDNGLHIGLRLEF